MHFEQSFLDTMLGDVGEIYLTGGSLFVLGFLTLVFLISYLTAVLIYFRNNFRFSNLQKSLYTTVAFFTLLVICAFFFVSHSLVFLMVILYLFLVNLLLVGIAIKDIIIKPEYEYLAKVFLLILIVFVVLGLDGVILSQFLLNGVILLFVAWIFLLLPFFSFQSYFKVKKRTNLYASIIILIIYSFMFWMFISTALTPFCCGL